jgi:hypothetical protein
MRLRAQAAHHPPAPAPLKVVPVDAQLELQARALIDCYLLGIDLDFGALTMPSILPSLLAHADQLARRLADAAAGPTSDAYEAACRAIEKHRARADELQAHVDGLIRQMASATAPPTAEPPADRSEADGLRALLREADAVWKDGTCDVQPEARPVSCACLGCRIHRAIEEG